LGIALLSTRSPVPPTADRFTEKPLAQPPLGIAFAIIPNPFADLDDRFAERAIAITAFVCGFGVKAIDHPSI
jgi:hypothetical protein